MTVRIQTEDFDIGAEIAQLRRANPKIGGVASFVGVVRDVNEGDAVAAMTLEHYPGMTEKALARIVEEAKSRWQIIDCTVIHRYGELKPTDPIVLVVVASQPVQGWLFFFRRLARRTGSGVIRPRDSFRSRYDSATRSRARSRRSRASRPSSSSAGFSASSSCVIGSCATRSRSASSIAAG